MGKRSANCDVIAYALFWLRFQSSKPVWSHNWQHWNVNTQFMRCLSVTFEFFWFFSLLSCNEHMNHKINALIYRLEMLLSDMIQIPLRFDFVVTTLFRITNSISRKSCLTTNYTNRFFLNVTYDVSIIPAWFVYLLFTKQCTLLSACQELVHFQNL